MTWLGAKGHGAITRHLRWLSRALTSYNRRHFSSWRVAVTQSPVVDQGHRGKAKREFQELKVLLVMVWNVSSSLAMLYLCLLGPVRNALLAAHGQGR